MRVLIIGKDSYIGSHFDEWLAAAGHRVTQLDVLDEGWRTFDYSPFDAIVHVAGIVHRPQCQDWELYKRVNADMPVEIATMAKAQGVRQYVFLSTMGVYGLGKRLEPNVVDENTPIRPNGMYGRSKWMAEEGLRELQDDGFAVACVRPPSVYGKGCRGGYITGFASVARRLPVIPEAYGDVKQSFIYIDNLSELVRQIIERRMSGAFCPQDDKAVSANELLKTITAAIGKEYHGSRLLGWGVWLLRWLPVVNKAYGGVEYSQSISAVPGVNYVVVPFDEGMRRTMAQ